MAVLLNGDARKTRDVTAKVQRLCVWSGPAFILLYVPCFWKIAGYLPPHPPSLSASNVALFYQLHANEIRIGQILCLILSTLLFPWFAVISAQMANVEGKFPVLAIIQFGGGVLLIVFFVLCGMLWIAATFQRDMDSNIILMMHDTSWLIFVMVFPAFTLQLVCIALVGFMDTSRPPWLPRWACYLNLWVGLGACGGTLAVFFKSGPFAWNGLVGFWIPVILFTLWIFVMAPLLSRSVHRH